MNVVSSFLLLSPEETVLHDEHSKPCGEPVLRLEQKSLTLVKALGNRMLYLAQLVQAPFLFVRSTAVIHLLLGKHCGFVRCDKHVQCLGMSMLAVVEGHAPQLLNQVSYSTADER